MWETIHKSHNVYLPDKQILRYKGSGYIKTGNEMHYFILEYRGNPNNPVFLQSYEWKRIRMIALKRDNATCTCCGASAKTGAVMHVDHIKSRKEHPELALDLNNLQVLCEDCNRGKDNKDSTNWRKK